MYLIKLILISLGIVFACFIIIFTTYKVILKLIRKHREKKL